ncbi:hypothetical protein MRB53_009718 [Persea americana]|uniref:Uncharacterized protein n=1 Tax=Persea americana TaxID=3435 RepID=A0ACC2LQZ5_PERAE|nr:hypothetical protein MRB53_009718 [Persea americana]
MASSNAFLVVFLSRFLLISNTQQLQLYHIHVLKPLRKHLEHAKSLEVWDKGGDLCSIPSSPELRFRGDKPFKMTERRFEGVRNRLPI